MDKIDMAVKNERLLIEVRKYLDTDTDVVYLTEEQYHSLRDQALETAYKILDTIYYEREVLYFSLYNQSTIFFLRRSISHYGKLSTIGSPHMGVMTINTVYNSSKFMLENKLTVLSDEIVKLERTQIMTMEDVEIIAKHSPEVGDKLRRDVAKKEAKLNEMLARKEVIIKKLAKLDT